MPTPQPTPRAVTFSFGSGVDGGDRAIVTGVIDASRKALTAASGIEAPTTVLAFDTLPALSQAYARLGSSQAARAPDVVRRLQNGVAEAGYRNVAVYTGGAFWKDADAVQRAQAISHEYVHVVQLELIGERLAAQTFLAATNQVPAGGPFWLFEGSAELVSWAVMQDIRLASLDAKLDEYAQRSKGDRTTLAQMENYIGYIGGGPAGVATSVLGVAKLIEGRPGSDLFRFWALIQTGQPWQTAFAIAFGKSVDVFYAEFEASR